MTESANGKCMVGAQSCIQELAWHDSQQEVSADRAQSCTCEL